MAARLAAAIVCALGAAASAAPQNGTGSRRVTVSGRVLDAGTGTPLPNVRVSPAIRAIGAQVVLSDYNGRFTLSLPVGQRTLLAAKTGFGREETTFAGRPIEFRLQRSAAISGRLTNLDGDPLIGVRVVAVKLGPDGQERTDVAGVSTDDRGEYRLGGLPAGTYGVSVDSEDAAFTRTREVIEVQRLGPGQVLRIEGPRPARLNPGPPKIFYPGIDAAEPGRLTLQPGDERTAIDFALDPPASEIDRRPLSATGNASVRGRVIDSMGQPIAKALVMITGQSPTAPGTRDAVSDSAGWFEFRQLPAGRFHTVATRAGYFTSTSQEPGATRPSQFVELTDGQRIEGFQVRVVKWASVSGRVVDENREPLSGVVVNLMRPRYEGGRRTLAPAGGQARTNDRGEYRIYGIAAGSYLVTTAVGDITSGELPGYDRSYYPGVIDPAAAQYVNVEAAADVAGIDVALTRSKTARISGQMLDSKGEPTMGGSVRLVPGAGSIVGITSGARIEKDGTFEFVNVPPGSYVIKVYQGRFWGWVEGDFAAVPVTVTDEDVSGLIIRPVEGSGVAGRIVFNAVEPKQPPSGGLEITTVPVDPLQAPPELASASIDASWNFRLDGITGTRRLQVPQVPTGWSLEAVRVNGVDVTDMPLQFGGGTRALNDVQIVLTDRTSMLNGTIVDARGRPVEGAVAIVFSTDRNTWYDASRFMKRTAAGDGGRFALGGLPAGRYYAVALSTPPPDGIDAWKSPDYLASLASRASTLDIVQGAASTVRLEILAR